MDPVSLVPAADTIQVNWLWFQIFLVAGTFFHLVSMNIMLGSGVVALVAPLIGGDKMRPMARDVAATLPYSIAFTINFGIVPLLFIQILYGQFYYTSTVLMAAFWLSIIFLLIVGYYSVYLFNAGYNKDGNHRHLFLGLSVLTLFIVGFFFANNISMMQRPESWFTYFQNRSGTILALGDKALVPRYLHFMFASISVGGLAIALYYEIKKRRGGEDCTRWISLGCNWFSLSSLINFLVGFWFLSRLYGVVIDPSQDGGKIFFALIIGGIVAIVFAVISAQSQRVYRAVAWLLLTVFFMVLAREVVRNVYLREYVNLAELPVVSQYSPLIVFLISVAAGVWLIYWMFKRTWIETGEKS